MSKSKDGKNVHRRTQREETLRQRRTLTEGRTRAMRRWSCRNWSLSVGAAYAIDTFFVVPVNTFQMHLAIAKAIPHLSTSSPCFGGPHSITGTREKVRSGSSRIIIYSHMFFIFYTLYIFTLIYMNHGECTQIWIKFYSFAIMVVLYELYFIPRVVIDISLTWFRVCFNLNMFWCMYLYWELGEKWYAFSDIKQLTYSHVREGVPRLVVFCKRNL